MKPCAESKACLKLVLDGNIYKDEFNKDVDEIGDSSDDDTNEEIDHETKVVFSISHEACISNTLSQSQYLAVMMMPNMPLVSILSNRKRNGAPLEVDSLIWSRF